MPRMSLTMQTKSDIVVARLIIIFVVVLPSLCPAAFAQRRLSAGEQMPEFSIVDLGGKPFEYKPGGKKILMVVFLSAKRATTAEAVGDIEEVVGDVAAKGKKLDIVVAVDDPNTSYFKSEPDGFSGSFHIVHDADFKLWGKFGIIATPTVIISGSDDKVLWAGAGHGYNFMPVLRANLYRALGIAQDSDPNKPGEAKAVENSTVAARIKRYVQMARMLGEKGRFESAVQQIQKAGELDPNSIDVALALTELHLKSGQSDRALRVVAQFISRKLSDKIKHILVSGREERKNGKLDAAEELLLEATTLDPNSSKALFELGKVYEAKDQADKAVATYRKALAIIFGDESGPGDSQN